jgi:hypothetical protein
LEKGAQNRSIKDIRNNFLLQPAVGGGGGGGREESEFGRKYFPAKPYLAPL